MVFEPINIVSLLPRILSSLSVKIWPRSWSAHIWISSTPTNSRSLSIGIDSTVHKKNLASGGIIFSSPVIKATLSTAIFLITLSYTSLANNLKGNPIIPLSKDNIVSMARWVFPVLVGPRTAVILFLVISIFGISFF